MLETKLGCSTQASLVGPTWANKESGVKKPMCVRVSVCLCVCGCARVCLLALYRDNGRGWIHVDCTSFLWGRHRNEPVVAAVAAGQEDHQSLVESTDWANNCGQSKRVGAGRKDGAKSVIETWKVWLWHRLKRERKCFGAFQALELWKVRHFLVVRKKCFFWGLDISTETVCSLV